MPRFQVEEFSSSPTEDLFTATAGDWAGDYVQGKHMYSSTELWLMPKGNCNKVSPHIESEFLKSWSLKLIRANATDQYHGPRCQQNIHSAGGNYCKSARKRFLTMCCQVMMGWLEPFHVRLWFSCHLPEQVGQLPPYFVLISFSPKKDSTVRVSAAGGLPLSCCLKCTPETGLGSFSFSCDF